MDTEPSRTSWPVATFDPAGSWGEMLGNVAWLRGHTFADILNVAQQHEEHISTGQRDPAEPFPRLLGSTAQWHLAGRQVLDHALGYDTFNSPRDPSTQMFSLAETGPEDSRNDAEFVGVEPADTIGAHRLRQRVWNDLSVRRERFGYGLTYTYDANQPRTLVDHQARSVRMPGWQPLSQRVADLAHIVTGRSIAAGDGASTRRPARRDRRHRLLGGAPRPEFHRPGPTHRAVPDHAARRRARPRPRRPTCSHDR
ncbi:hypothetical protein [Promicromonospora sp. AC04]|uniref:hypothetical protein n=1 Tax=Promicromonospora sp. AC04 TaxID=2135723 RepID=UPI0011B1DA42|nr:hypothetical protein [Promicromonospora sp. AC04]